MSYLDRLDLKGVHSHESAIRLLERQRAILASRERLMPFVRFIHPDHEDPDDATKSSYSNQPFHDKIAQALEDFERGDNRQIIFAMPPRHGKTQLATKCLSAWITGRHPNYDIAVASYSDSIAEDIGADVRTMLQSPQFKQVFPQYKLRMGGKAKGNIQNSEGGRLVFLGRNAGLTGRGASVLLIDDLYRDFEESRSPVIRDQAYNWFTKVAMTRRMGPKLVCITMTRWHSDDIVGRITDPLNPCYSEAEAKKWKIIKLPATAEDDDPLGRPFGQPLWPERFDLEFLESQRNMDGLGYASLYQQAPSVADGIMFKRENIRYYEPGQLPGSLRYYGASDHAVGTAQRNDLTCLLKGGVDYDDNLWLTDCIWQRMSADLTVDMMIEMYRGQNKPLLWWSERSQISMSLGPFMYKRMAEEGIHPNIVDVTPSKDKSTRAQSIAGRVARGKVFFPRGAPWTERAVDELLAFPNGLRDDFCDTLAWFGIGLQSMFRPRREPEKPKEPVFGTLNWVRHVETYEKQKAATAMRGGY